MGNSYYGPTRMKKSSAGNGPKGRGRGPAEKAGRVKDDPMNWGKLPGKAGPERNTVNWPTIKVSVVKQGGHF